MSELSKLIKQQKKDKRTYKLKTTCVGKTMIECEYPRLTDMIEVAKGDKPDAKKVRNALVKTFIKANVSEEFVGEVFGVTQARISQILKAS